jgi:hypothetical protein
MINKKIILILSMLFFGLLMTCSDADKNEDECRSTQMAFVTSVNSPSTGLVNEKINIVVNFPVYNGCGSFGKFIETKNNTRITIEVEARYEGCICSQDVPIRTVNYEFIPRSTGNYKLNFKSSPTEVITVNLTII